MKKAYINATIERFETAVEAYAFRGTIPRYESEEAGIAYDEICLRYKKAKLALLTMYDKLNSQPQKHTVVTD